MYSKAKIGTHPIHPMLVAFPITFYVLTPIAYAIYQYGSDNLFWYRLGYFANMAAVATALVAAVPGFIDWAFGIPNHVAAKKRGLIHMVLNLVGLTLFVVSAILVRGTWDQPPANLIGMIFLTALGVLVVASAGYHGWELIAVHKVGVIMTPQQESMEPVEKMHPKDHGAATSNRPTLPH